VVKWNAETSYDKIGHASNGAQRVLYALMHGDFGMTLFVDLDTAPADASGGSGESHTGSKRCLQEDHSYEGCLGGSIWSSLRGSPTQNLIDEFIIKVVNGEEVLWRHPSDQPRL